MYKITNHFDPRSTWIKLPKELRSNKNEVGNSDFSPKPVVVNFWATWCAPCLKELPDLLKAKDTLQDEVIFIFVSDESIEKVYPFMMKRNFKGNFYCTSFLLENLGLKVRPATYFYDENGKISDKHLGPLDYNILIERFKIIN